MSKAKEISKQQTCIPVTYHDEWQDGFGTRVGFSGHRNETMAVIQLASRTGADTGISLHPMVEEVMRGLILGESIETFLPDTLKRHLPDGPLSNEEQMSVNDGHHTIENNTRPLL